MTEPISSMLPCSSLFLAILLHFVWQATLIVALVAIARSLIHPKYFSARYLISVSGLIAVLISPLVTAGFYLTSDVAMQSLQTPVAATGPSLTESAPAASLTSLLETQFKFVFNWFDNHRLFWLGCWMSGFVVLLLRLLVSLGHCYRLRRLQIPLPPHLQELAETLKRKLNLTGSVIVASSREITQAVATGIIKPVVLVPSAWIAQLPVASIEAVLAHELAHHKRWDLWINLFQRLAETVFFFHPLVWWLSQVISNEREVCCDHLAIKVTGQPVQYVETLAQVASTTTFGEFEFQFGNAFIGGKNMNLLRRAKMILEPSSIDAQSPFRTLVLIACTGLLISYGSYAYGATPVAAKALFQERNQDRSNGHDGDPKHDSEIMVRRSANGSDQNGTYEVVVIDDETEGDNFHQKLHGHLIELLHGQESGQVNKQQLARQLRQLADSLEAERDSADSNDKPRRRIEIQRTSDRPMEHRVEFENADTENRVIRVETRPATGRFVLERDQPRQKVIELRNDERGDVSHQDQSQNRFIVRGPEHAPDSNAHFHGDLRIVTDTPHEVHDLVEMESGNGRREHEMHFGEATTSDGELGQVLRELKNEVQELRREVNQLRSDRDLPMNRPVRAHVQERINQSNQRIELKRVDGDKDVPRDDGRRATGVWIEAGSRRYDVGRDSKAGPGKIWVEKKDGVDREIQGFEIKPRLNRNNGNLNLDVEVRENAAAAQPREKDTWVVDVEQIVEKPASEQLRKQPKRNVKKPERDNDRFEVEIEDKKAMDDDATESSETKSSATKKKKK